MLPQPAATRFDFIYIHIYTRFVSCAFHALTLSPTDDCQWCLILAHLHLCDRLFFPLFSSFFVFVASPNMAIIILLYLCAFFRRIECVLEADGKPVTQLQQELYNTPSPYTILVFVSQSVVDVVFGHVAISSASTSRNNISIDLNELLLINNNFIQINRRRYCLLSFHYIFVAY